MSAPPAPAPRQLLTGPAGSGKTHQALEAVREAATTMGPRGRGARGEGEVLLVLPTYAQAMHTERVALSRWGARAVLDDPFVTFTSAGERFLEGFRVRALPTSEERDALMHESLAALTLPLFEAVRDRPGFRARLLRLVKEIKQSGLPPEEGRERLARAAARLEPKAQERLTAFLAVFEIYDRLLVEAGLADHEDTLRDLLETLRRHPPRCPPRLVVVDGFDDFTPIEQAILDALTEAVVDRGGRVLVTLPWEDRRAQLFAASAPARTHLRARGFVETPLASFARAERGTTLAEVAAGLFRPPGPADPPSRPDETVRLVVAGDPQDEAEAIAREARRLRRDGRLQTWRELGVVVRRLDEAGPRLAAALERLGVPVRIVGVGFGLAAEGLVRALDGPLSVLGGAIDAGAFQPAPLATWLRWRALARGDDEALDRVDQAEMSWRRDGFPADWGAWYRAASTGGLEADSLERWRRTLHGSRLAAVVFPALAGALDDLAPLPRPGGFDADGRPLDPRADGRRRRASASRDRLRAILEGLSHAVSRSPSRDAELDIRSAVAAFRDAVLHARLSVEDRRLDAVSLLDAEEARFWELPFVFVAGLVQGQFPLLAREDVLLRDSEREQLRTGDATLALPMTRDREVRERRLFYGALTRARKGLVLFRSGCDADGGLWPPSSFLRDLGQVVDVESHAERRPPGRPAPLASECYTVKDWELFAAAGFGASIAEPVERDRRLAGALLACGDDTLLSRAARWRLPDADRVSSQRQRDRCARATLRLSPSALRSALSCRHRFFLQYVVGIPEDQVPFEGPVFKARDEGVLLHETLRRAVLDEHVPPEAVVRDVLIWAEGEGAGDVVLPSGFDRDLFQRELTRVIRLLRRRETEMASALRPLPGGLELAFEVDVSRLCGGEGASFLLTGQIDRVDVAGRRAVIIDYKRSVGGVETASKALDESLDVQLPLYAAAVEALHGLDVVGFEWVAATRRARRGRWSAAASDLQRDRREGDPLKELPRERFRSLLAEALALSIDAVADLRAGRHAKQRQDARRCGACPWRTVCRPGGRGRSNEGGET